MEEHRQEFQNRNTGLIAISTDTQPDALRMSTLLDTTYPVLSDPDAKVVREFGLYNLLGDGISAPAVFIITPDASIQWQYIGQNAVDRPSLNRILTELDIVLDSS